MRFTTTTFPSRFAGPRPEWANGGVIAGSLAADLPGSAVAVRIERPVPTGADLMVEAVDDMVELRDPDGPRLAHARRVEHEFDDLPPAVDLDTAASTTPAVPRDGHPAAGCFVCGPENPHGLDLQPGPMPDRADLAALWVVGDDLVGAAGESVHPSIVWAAMDCPGWYVGCGGQMALLGSMTAQQFAPVRAGDEVVVQSWARGTSGRKVFVGSTLRSADGAVIAASHATWIMTPDLAVESTAGSAATRA